MAALYQLYQMGLLVPQVLATLARPKAYVPDAPPQFSLLDLPPELIVITASHLSSSDLSAFSRCSHTLYELSMPVLYQLGLASTRPSTSTHFQWCPTPDRTTLHFAAAHGNLALLTALIRRLGSHNMHLLDARDSYGHTPLISAILRNHEAVVRVLIEAGANVECTAKRFAWSPLHCAAALGSADIARVLVAAGANPERRDSTDMTPIHLLALTKYGTQLCPIFEAMGFDGKKLDSDGYDVESKCRVITLLSERMIREYRLVVDLRMARSTGVIDPYWVPNIVHLADDMRFHFMQMLGYEMDMCLMCERAPDVLSKTAINWHARCLPRFLKRGPRWGFFGREVLDEKLLAREMDWRK